MTERIDISLDMAQLDINDTQMLPNGLFAQPCIDLHILRLCCLVSEYTFLGNDGSKVMPHALRMACADAVQNVAMISVRIKSLFKTVNGAHRQLGKLAWELITKTAETQKQNIKVSAPKKVKELCVILESLKEGWGDDEENFVASDRSTTWLTLTDDLSDFLGEHISNFEALADAYGGALISPQSKEEEDISNLLEDAPQSLIGHIARILTLAPLGKFAHDMFERSMLTSDWFFAFKKSVVDAGQTMQD